MKQVSTIEQIATILINNKISFEYSSSFLQVKDSSFDVFNSASYHAETKELILMDKDFNNVPVGYMAVRMTKTYWKSIP